MDKPTLLYASPFWPKKSGISEYSEALIEGLDIYFDVTLVTDSYKLENRKIREKYKIISYDSNTDFNGYDYIVYNFGNNPEYHGYMYEMIQKYRGYIILHDYVLYYLAVGFYSEKNMLFQKIYELEGIRGIQLVKVSLKKNESKDLLHHKDIAAMLPMNKEIIEKAKGIFVHSDYTKQIIDRKFKDVNVNRINLVKCETMQYKENKFLHRHFKIDNDAYIIGSVGFIAETKQNELVCLTIKKYNETHEDKVHYVMIGDGNYVDHLLDEYIHKTGFWENKKFFEAINSCNLILNLRYPYNGESSATLIQCMDMGKPCVVSDIGWFSEIPDDSVIKVPTEILVDELCDKVDEIKNSNLEKMINCARNYVEKNCLPEKVAQALYKLIVNKKDILLKKN